MRVLVVTPDVRLVHDLADAFDPVPSDVCAGYEEAHARLLQRSYDLIVTELRLGPYNGLQLPYFARRVQPRIRTVVFTAPFDPFLASEAIAAGAFFEHTHRIVAAARSYLGAMLPEYDRRDPAFYRRGNDRFPTGHRAADRH